MKLSIYGNRYAALFEIVNPLQAPRQKARVRFAVCDSGACFNLYPEGKVMANVTSTRTTRRKPSQAKAQTAKGKQAVKRSTRKAASADKAPSTRKPRQTARKPRKASTATKKPTRRSTRKANSGGGRALSDFANSDKLRVVKKAEIPSRADCFRTGQTVSANLAAQKEAGFFGRRKFLRTQIATGRVSLRK